LNEREELKAKLMAHTKFKPETIEKILDLYEG